MPRVLIILVVMKYVNSPTTSSWFLLRVYLASLTIFESEQRSDHSEYEGDKSVKSVFMSEVGTSVRRSSTCASTSSLYLPLGGLTL